MKPNKKSEVELIKKKEKMVATGAQLYKSSSVQVINRNVLVHASLALHQRQVSLKNKSMSGLGSQETFQINDPPLTETKTEKTFDEPPQTKQEDSKLIRVGICCREKKMKSRPMQKILGWLEKSSEFQICRMNDEMILNRPIEEWLRCDILIGFYSYGFPL